MKRIVMIGSGNVATSLAHALRGRCRLGQVYSRRMEHARQLADAVGVSRQTINAIEKGDYNPTIKLCLAICRALGRTLDELFWPDDAE